MTDFNDLNCDCFICLQERSIETNLLPVRLKNQNYYIKSCKCDGWIHYACLEDWMHVNNSCPICRMVMYVKPRNDGPSQTASCALCILCTSSLFSIAVWLFYYY